MSEQVLVTGATGGVGQLVVAKLLDKQLPVRVLTRNAEKARQMFAGQVEIAIADTLQPETLAAAVQDVDCIICCTGTTAFPSDKWNFDLPADGFQQWIEWGKIYLDADYRRNRARNGPQQVDAEGVKNLVMAAPRSLTRFVFVSSCGVERKDQFPYSLLNAFGVLDAKQQGEQAIAQSGLPYTIIRPGQLIDGPFTSFDLNTLLQAKTGGKLGIVMGTGDTLTGQASRIDVAAACVECLEVPITEGRAFELINQGSRPTEISWPQLFAQSVG